jgi:hypothetical protein
LGSLIVAGMTLLYIRRRPGNGTLLHPAST